MTAPGSDGGAAPARGGWTPWLALSGVVIVAAFALWARVGPVAGEMGVAQAYWGLASLGWLMALASLARGKSGPGRQRAARADLALIVVGALILRALALGGDPRLSDDVNRYVWEGALVAEGISPYAHAPASNERVAERARWNALYGRVNHPEVSAAYPPLAQAAFAALVASAGGAEVEQGRAAERRLRVFFALCDLALLAALCACLRARGSDPRWALAWGWSPLAAAEFAGSAHYDVLAMLALVLGLWASARARPRLSAALLSAGGMVKLLPFIALPWVARLAAGKGSARGRRASIGILSVAAAVALLAGAWVLALEGGASGLTHGLGEYGLRWESTNVLYRFVEPLLPEGLVRDRAWSDPRILGRALIALAGLVIAIATWRSVHDPARASARLVRAALVLSPTLHPWYVAWSLPFLALCPSRAWALLPALTPLLYWPLARWQAEAVWDEPAWLWSSVFLPFLFVSLWELGTRFRSKSHPPAR